MKKFLSLIAVLFLFTPLAEARIVIQSGRTVVTTAGTAVVLSPTTGTIPYAKIDICAETDNTGYITVGGPAVVASLSTRKGVPLAAGGCYSITSERTIGAVSEIWIDSTVNGDGVTWNAQEEIF